MSREEEHFKSEVKKGLEAMRVLNNKRLYFSRLHRFRKFIKILNKIKTKIFKRFY